MIVGEFPLPWQTSLTVHRIRYDPKGDPLPGSDHTIGPCLIGWRSTEDPVDRSDLTTDTAVAYIDDPQADVQAGDRITIPPGRWPSGEFRVDGTPKPWQMGLELPLRRN